MKEETGKGILLMALAWALFGLMAACGKYAYQYTTPKVTFFFQNFGAFVFLSLLFLRPGFSLFSSERWPLLIARGVFGAFAFYCFFLSISFIPLTDGTLLNTTAPLFLPLVLLLWRKQKSSAWVWSSAAIGFFGVLLILKPSREIFQLGSIPGLLSGIGSAIVIVLIRLLALENPKRVVLIYLLIASAAVFPFAAPALPHLPAAAWPALLLMGLLFGAGQFAYTRALAYGEPTLLAPFIYTFVLVASLLDWAMWDRIPTFWTFIGMMLIISGGILSILWSRAKEPVKEI